VGIYQLGALDSKMSEISELSCSDILVLALI